uniref:hypothetical protein n=1 Tax=Pseudomonas sp. KK4 TaxID=1855729 RepID=UPI0011159CCD
MSVQTDASRINPVILTPANESKHPPFTSVLMSGTCQEGARVEVFNIEGTKIADAVVIGIRWFCYRVWGVEGDDAIPASWFGWIGQGAGSLTFFVVQTVGTDRIQSGNCSFSVGTLEKSSAPTINFPEDGGQYVIGERFPADLVGDCVLGAKVDIAVNGSWNKHFAEAANGIWHGSHEVIPGVMTFQARQTVPGLLTSDPGPLVTARYAVSNNEALMDMSTEERSSGVSSNARKPLPPKITMPMDGANFFVEETYLIMGECEKDATLVLDRNGHETEVTVIDGKWYTFGLNNYPSGYDIPQKYRAKQKVNGSEFSDYSDAITVNFPMSPPLILFPVNGGTYSAFVVYVSGVCDYDAEVEIIAAQDGAVLGKAVVVGTTWVYRRDWTSGVKHIKARQT